MFRALSVARRCYKGHTTSTKAFRVQVENGLEDIFFLHFSLVSIQKDDSEYSISGQKFIWHSFLKKNVRL